MACFHPLAAFQTATGEVVFYESRRSDVVRSLTLPCGQCVGCRLERSRQWAVRCMHEASLYKDNCFITLTYDDANLPEGSSLEYDDFQRFMKRLRKKFSGTQPGSTGKYPIRFYMAGEYGENFGRPHFHACLFNFNFADRKYWGRTPSGSKIYRSAELEALWPFGFSSIGEVNFQSAAYVARYIMKKVTGKAALDHYEFVDSDGVVRKRRPEFNKMSLKPGIGADWYDKWKDDVYPHDYVVVNGRKAKPPRYYDKKYKDDYPYEWDEVEFKRYQSRLSVSPDENSDERLAVREHVTLARLARLKRHI